MCKLMEAPAAHNSDKQTVSGGFPSKIINTPPKSSSTITEDSLERPAEATLGTNKPGQTGWSS